jgi:hypothetical protein
MTMLVLLHLLATLVTSAAASRWPRAGPDRPTRADVLAHAGAALRANGATLATRTPRRAPPYSTFASFLSGSTTKVCVSEDCNGVHVPIPSDRAAAYHHHRDATTAQQSADPGWIDPAAFGGDPTGARDSSDAFDKAVAELLARNTSGKVAGSGTVDLGGARIHLMGGDYQISRPIVIPHGYANFGIGHGTIRAGAGFPPALKEARYLVEISDVSVEACMRIDPGQKSCNENVDVSDLLLDGARIAHGGLLINATMGGNVGPDVYSVNFMRAGISVHGGHEVMIHEAWLGATYYGTPNHTLSEAGSTASELIGNDHVISDVIVFGGQVGVRNQGGANLLEGIHTWNDATHDKLSPGIGILVTNSQSVRCLNVYLDFTALRIEGVNHISVVDSFFLGGGTIVLAPRADGAARGNVVDGLVVTDNTWENFNAYNGTSNVTVVVDERTVAFQGPPTDVIMTGNIGTNTMIPRAVTASKTLAFNGAKKLVFDFSDSFVFPSLPAVDATFSASVPVGFPQLAVRPPVGQTVTVEADQETNAIVTVTATQGVFTVGNGGGLHS